MKSITPFLSPAQLTSLVIGISIGCIILTLVRKNHLLIGNSVWWLILAGASIILGVYSRLIDIIGRFLGIHYPPILLVILATGVILIKMLTMDLKQSEQERKIRRLAEKLAILEGERYPEPLPRAGQYPDGDNMPNPAMVSSNSTEHPTIT